MSGSLQTTPPPITDSIFTEIPNNIQVPGEYMQVVEALQNTGSLPYPAHLVVIGQMRPTGTAAPNTIYPLLSAAQATQLGGAGSAAEAMAAAALASNPLIPVDLICVPAAGGATSATGTFTVTGAWTQNGLVEFDIGGLSVLVPAGASDTAAVFVANAVLDINETQYMQVTAIQGAGAASNQLILTANCANAEGNAIDLWVNMTPGNALPPGMAVAIAPMAGGTANPAVTPALTAIGNRWYTDMVNAWTDATNAGLLAAWSANAYVALGRRDCQIWTCIGGTYAAMITEQSTRNSPYRCALGITNSPTPPWIVAASLAGVAAQALSDDPARQLRGRALPMVRAPRAADIIQFTEQQLLLTAGIGTYEVENDGTVVLQRVVTEYLLNPQGVPDPSLHDVMTVKVNSRVRWDWNSYVALTYPGSKLALDGSLAAQYDSTVATPRRLAGSWAARYLVYAKNGWLENEVVQARAATFSIDPNNPNRVLAAQPTTVIGNMMILTGSLQFALSA